MATKLVFNIRAAASSDLRSLSRHCSHRDPDGWSRIDLARSHLNEQLYGDAATINDCLDAWYERTGAKRPAKQAEAPYLTIVLGASPEFFRNPENLASFRQEALSWLRHEFGDDLVFAELHLDETTPHIHAVVAPTYEKKPRVPGKQKKGETAAQFEARKRAAMAAPGERAVGRSSSRWSSETSFEDLRKSATAALSSMGITYGTPLPKDQRPQTVRGWVANGFRQIMKKWPTILKRETALDEKEAQLRQLEENLHLRELHIREQAGQILKDQIENRRLRTDLQSLRDELRRTIPWFSLKPEAKQRIEKDLAKLDDRLGQADKAIKALSKSAGQVHDGMSEGAKFRPH